MNRYDDVGKRDTVPPDGQDLPGVSSFSENVVQVWRRVRRDGELGILGRLCHPDLRKHQSFLQHIVNIVWCYSLNIT